MMNSPYFRNYSKQPPSHSARFVPSQQTLERASPKVVSVPVHFISSDQPRTRFSMLKDSTAIKIQKVFRGFLVRRSVKKIVSIRNEVTEIEQRIDDSEVVNLLRSDAKERLKVNETLMSLLFKLDSIRGVDYSVRDLRKAVTRKAISLQEKVDSIAQSDEQTLDSRNNDSDKLDIDNGCTSTSEGVVKEAVKKIVENCNDVKATDDDCCVDDRGKRDVVEKMMKDNEKMMKLLMKISERNEMQTRMINSLSRRVEQLEKTEKMRRKNKKKRNVASI